MKRAKKSNRKSKDEEMTLVDCYYIPTVIAEQFSLFPKVTRESREDVGEVVVSYDAEGLMTCEVTLSPVEVSKLEKEISADRLKKYIESKIIN